MGDIIRFPKVEQQPEMKLLKNLPDAMPTFIVTGYTDLRQSVSGLSQLLEDRFDLDPRSKSISFFCGRKVDRIKALMYDGDGYIVMTKRFDSRKLKWPRLGGRGHGDLWVLTHEQFEVIMSGERMLTEDDIDQAGDNIEEPKINTYPNTLYHHMISYNCVPQRIYLCTGYTDLRHSIDTYCEIANRYNKLERTNDAFFVFCGNRTDRIKILYYDGDGYLLISKYFDNTHLQWPRVENEMWDVVYSQFREILEGKKLPREQAIRIHKPK